MVFRFLYSILFISLSVYVLFIFIAYYFQAKFIFIPSQIPSGHTYQFNAAFVEFNDLVKDHKVNSVLFKSKDSKGVILYFHGNAGDMLSWGQVASEITEKTHWDVWMIDYYGYGKSEGIVTSSEDLFEIGEYFYQKVKEHYPAQKIVIYGRSIGTGVATKVASDNSIQGLILESPYFNLHQLVNEKIWLWFPSVLLKFKFNNNLALQAIKSPTLILHGKKDSIIPFHHALELAKINSNTRLVEISDGDHNDLMNFPEYWSSLNQFLNTINQ